MQVNQLLIIISHYQNSFISAVIMISSRTGFLDSGAAFLPIKSSNLVFRVKVGETDALTNCKLTDRYWPAHPREKQHFWLQK